MIYPISLLESHCPRSISAKDAAAVMDNFSIFSLWTRSDKEKPQVKDPLLPQPDWEHAPGDVDDVLKTEKEKGKAKAEEKRP